MSLVKSTLEPDSSTIFEVISKNTLQRNRDVCPFVELLDKANDFSSIALNGPWGSGKTFFIKQTKMLIDYLDPTSNLEKERRDHIKAMIDHQSGALENLINSSHLTTLYFDAWLYDDTPDPLKSLLLFLATSLSSSYATKPNDGIEKITSIIDIINIWSSGSTKQVVKAFKKTSTIDDLYDLEKIKDQIRDALADIILDDQRLVIFIDELDRCNPVYAVKLLEKIKHFFNSPKILFIFSINMEQLAATIKKVYGAEFDSSGYLNKFFDIVVDIPPISNIEYLSWAGIKGSQYTIDGYYKSLINSMHMTIRDTIRYLDQLRIIYAALKKRTLSSVHWDIGETIAEMLFCPFIIALKIKDLPNYYKFINGEAEDILWIYCNMWDEFSDFVGRTFFDNQLSATSEQQKEAVTSFYKAVFIKKKPIGWEHMNSNIGSFFSETKNYGDKILSICSLVGDYHDYTVDQKNN